MVKNSCLQLSAVLALLMLIVLSGCTGRSKPARFYTLTSLAEKVEIAAESGPAFDKAIGLGPIKLADYLNQNRIVTRMDGNRIKQAEFDQWAGSFRDNLTNILAENIGFLLATDRVLIYPWRSYIPIEYQVMVDIVRFDGQPGREVTLIARWSVLRGEGKEVYVMKRSDIIEKVGTSGYEGLVAAQSRALARLSRDIAEAITAAENKQRTGK